ncbi:MAG: hypothetical protein Metus_1355 [Candidatus Methanosuratincola subterraneus]|uniref:Uncharacterized protein n=1 Tax=Methanosuratincola subterraneus TaxID=2593994 RepID=A0A3S4UGH3_METS7|nr:MAG: hypothetical protein Metus_1355 [Candidatus Methanosuratincola subterraneus]
MSIVKKCRKIEQENKKDENFSILMHFHKWLFGIFYIFGF